MAYQGGHGGGYNGFHEETPMQDISAGAVSSIRLLQHTP